jgi:hypothetical protein
MFLGSMVYLLPPVILIPVKNFISYMVNKEKFLGHYKSFEFYLILMALPNIIFFTFVFISSEHTFPHWIMPGWLLLLPIISRVITNPINQFMRLFFAGSFFIIWPLLGLLIIHTQTGFLTNHLKIIPKWDNTLELIDWQPLRDPLKNLIHNYANNTEVKLAAFTWTEAGQLSTMMENKYETLVIEGDPHHFAYLRNSTKTAPTFLLKLSLGIKPDIPAILSRIKKYDASAIHIKNLILLRGPRPYATASVYLLTQ